MVAGEVLIKTREKFMAQVQGLHQTGRRAEIVAKMGGMVGSASNKRRLRWQLKPTLTKPSNNGLDGIKKLRKAFSNTDLIEQATCPAIP